MLRQANRFREAMPLVSQPSLFPIPEPAPASLTARLRELALVANASCLDTAAVLAQEAALGWWDTMVAGAGGNPVRLGPATPIMSTRDLPTALVAQARALGVDLAGLPVPHANDLLGQLYAQALPTAHRTAFGVFYTPPALVERLLSQAEAAGHDWAGGRAIDPACGAGAFLVQMAERMAAGMTGSDPAITLSAIGARLRGWELDRFAAWLAQLTTEAVLLPQVIASGRRLRPLVEVTDALLGFGNARESWGLVAGNPPFGKVKDTPDLRARFRRSLHGHPNLYGMFLDAAVHLAEPGGGVIAFLTPASFLAGHYFKNLRRLLHEQAPPVSIDLVESRIDVFQDVLQEVALSVFRRGQPVARADCTAIRLTATGMHAEATGSLCLPGNLNDPWTLPRHKDDGILAERLHAMPTRLADWGYGVATGPLVWNRHKQRLHDTRGPERVPVVWAESVLSGGHFLLKAVRRNHRAWFEPRGSTDPNLVDRPCVLVQRTTAKEQSRRLIAAEMPAGLLARFGKVAVENHLNMIRPTRSQPGMPLETLAAFLMTETADRVLRCINASVAVSASELAAMPLPPAEAVAAAWQRPGFDRAIRVMYGLADE
jgi:adenine-specific DNA-methyltransferase